MGGLQFGHAWMFDMWWHLRWYRLSTLFLPSFLTPPADCPHRWIIGYQLDPQVLPQRPVCLYLSLSSIFTPNTRIPSTQQRILSPDTNSTNRRSKLYLTTPRPTQRLPHRNHESAYRFLHPRRHPIQRRFLPPLSGGTYPRWHDTAKRSSLGLYARWRLHRWVRASLIFFNYVADGVFCGEDSLFI